MSFAKIIPSPRESTPSFSQKTKYQPYKNQQKQQNTCQQKYLKQTQRKNNIAKNSNAYSSTPSNQKRARRLKTQISAHKENQRKFTFEFDRLFQNQQQSENCQHISPSDQLFTLQIRYESLQRNHNLIKRQLEQYKKKAYEKTDTYMKLLQKQTQKQLKRFSDIELQKLKIQENRKQNQNNTKQLEQKHHAQIFKYKENIQHLQLKLLQKQKQKQNIQTLSYQREYILQQTKKKLSLTQEKLQQNLQQTKIYIESLLVKNKQTQTQFYAEKEKVRKCQIDIALLKQQKKQMEGEIHVLLAIEQKKSQELQIYTNKIENLEQKLKKQSLLNQGRSEKFELLGQQYNKLQEKFYQKSRQIQFKNQQVQALKQKELALIQSQMKARQKHEFIIQKKNKQIQQFTHQNERLYRQINHMKLKTNELCIKYNIKEGVF